MALKDGATLKTYFLTGAKPTQTQFGDFVDSSLAGWKNIQRDFGAVGDGTTDDTAAFQSAATTEGAVFVPAGTYKITDTITLTKARFVGAGWGTAGGAVVTKLLFSNLGTKAAFKTTAAATVNLHVGLESLWVQANSWDPSTGCIGYGLDIERPITCRNILVSHFKKSNIFVHTDATGNSGPFGSLFDTVYSQYAGEHGILVGTGANAVTFVNPISYWSGAPSYGTAPSVAGNYDGFLIIRDGDGNPGSAYFSTLPTDVRVYGGDSSYNSRYGWNFNQVQFSNLFPGFCELNKQTAPGQVNLGAGITRSHISIACVVGGSAAVNFGVTGGAEQATNSVWVCGLFFGGGGNSGGSNPNQSFSFTNIWTYVANTNDRVSGVRFVPTFSGGNPTGELTIGVFGAAGNLIIDSQTNGITTKGNIFATLGNLILDNTKAVQFKDTGATARTILTVTSGDNVQLNTPPGAGSIQLQVINATGDIILYTNSTERVKVKANGATKFSGSTEYPLAAKTAAYTLTATDSFVTGDATGAAFNVTLPTAVGITGREYTVKRINSGANAVTVDTTSSQTIDGAATYALSAQWATLTVVSDGANWLIKSKI